MSRAFARFRTSNHGTTDMTDHTGARVGRSSYRLRRNGWCGRSDTPRCSGRFEDVGSSRPPTSIPPGPRRSAAAHGLDAAADVDDLLAARASMRSTSACPPSPTARPSWPCSTPAWRCSSRSRWPPTGSRRDGRRPRSPHRGTCTGWATTGAAPSRCTGPGTCCRAGRCGWSAAGGWTRCRPVPWWADRSRSGGPHRRAGRARARPGPGPGRRGRAGVRGRRRPPIAAGGGEAGHRVAAELPRRRRRHDDHHLRPARQAPGRAGDRRRRAGRRGRRGLAGGPGRHGGTATDHVRSRGSARVAADRAFVDALRGRPGRRRHRHHPTTPRPCAPTGWPARWPGRPRTRARGAAVDDRSRPGHRVRRASPPSDRCPTPTDRCSSHRCTPASPRAPS